jgi:hypothetical protein
MTHDKDQGDLLNPAGIGLEGPIRADSGRNRPIRGDFGYSLPNGGHLKVKNGDLRPFGGRIPTLGEFGSYLRNPTCYRRPDK